MGGEIQFYLKNPGKFNCANQLGFSFVYAAQMIDDSDYNYYKTHGWPGEKSPTIEYSFRTVNQDLVQELYQDKKLKSLAFFYLLKLHFKNSVVYPHNSSVSQLALLAGCSKPTVVKHLRILEELELIFKDQHNSLFLKSLKRTKWKKTNNTCERIPMKKSWNLTQIADALKLVYFAKQSKQQTFRMNKSYKSTPATVKDDENSTAVSCLKISKFFGKSTGYACRIKRKLTELGLITFKRNHIPIGLAQQYDHIPDDCYEYNNYVYKRKTCSFTLEPLISL